MNLYIVGGRANGKTLATFDRIMKLMETMEDYRVVRDIRYDNIMLPLFNSRRMIMRMAVIDD